MTAQFITTERGEELVIIPRAEYEQLVDLKAKILADERIEDTGTARIVDAYLAHPPTSLPLSVWDAIEAGSAPLRAIREHRGLTQMALAAAAGLSQTIISKLESGERTAKAPQLKALALALQVSAADLIPD
jgi:DNA-binding XRE family transcriptional regulator